MRIENASAGMRGAILSDGTTLWIEAGATVETDADVIDLHPDLTEVKAKPAKADAGKSAE